LQATLDNVVPEDGCVQQKLNQLAERSDFQENLQDKVKKYKLDLNEVRECVRTIYDKRPHRPGNGVTPLLLHEDDVTTAERAVLSSFFLLQCRWTNPVR
jgi:hypothetical protein